MFAFPQARYFWLRSRLVTVAPAAAAATENPQVYAKQLSIVEPLAPPTPPAPPRQRGPNPGATWPVRTRRLLSL